MPARTDSVVDDDDALRRDDERGAKDDGVLERGVEDDGVLDMESGAVSTAAAESTTFVNDEVAPARAPVDSSRWGCLGAVSVTKRKEAQAKQPRSFRRRIASN